MNSPFQMQKQRYERKGVEPPMPFRYTTFQVAPHIHPPRSSSWDFLCASLSRHN